MPSQPHIAMVLGAISRISGGLYYSVRELSQSLAGAHVPIGVTAPWDALADSDRGAWDGVPTCTPYRWPPHFLGWSPGMERYLARGNFDLVHQHGIWMAFSIHVARWRKRTGRPVVISPRGMLDTWAVGNMRWKKKLAGGLFENSNLRSASCLHALSHSEAQAFRAYGLRNPIAVIPNGVAPSSEHASAHARPAYMPTEKSVLLFLGRLHPKKGVCELIRAFADACQADSRFASRWHLVLAGWDDGGFDQKPSILVEELGMSQFVSLPGALYGADKEAAFAHSDAFILPSYSEGLPMAVLEAWARGVPVLMTEAANLPEGFAAGAAAAIDTEPATLSLQLREVLGRDLRGMGAAGRTLAREQFAWQAIAGRHLAVYKFLLDGGPRPPDLHLY